MNHVGKTHANTNPNQVRTNLICISETSLNLWFVQSWHLPIFDSFLHQFIIHFIYLSLFCDGGNFVYNTLHAFESGFTTFIDSIKSPYFLCESRMSWGSFWFLLNEIYEEANGTLVFFSKKRKKNQDNVHVRS